MYGAEWIWGVFIPELVNKDSKFIIDTIEQAKWIWEVFIPELVSKDAKLIIDTIEQAILYGKKN